MNRSANPAEHRVRALVVHGETIFCAGAQTMLAYFMRGAADSGLDVTIAMAPNEKLSSLLPPGASIATLPSNQKFSLPGLLRQALALRRIVRAGGFEVLHGWTARDWELSSVARWITGRPAVGLLHDHPLAPHISGGRRRMMKLCARRGLDRVLCVSGAVSTACAEAGYPSDRLLVVRNGIPHPAPPPAPTPGAVVRLGYLGVFSERKGLRALFRILDELGRLQPEGWELHLAGGAQDEAGKKLVDELRAGHSDRPWWPRLYWAGWVKKPVEFLTGMDLLIVPSREFDPFPTVLLETGSAARPVLAARVGGVAEIVKDHETGWLFDPAQPAAAATQLAALLRQPALLTRAGEAAARRVRSEFSVEHMSAGYRGAYLDLIDRPRRNP